MSGFDCHRRNAKNLAEKNPRGEGRIARWQAAVGDDPGSVQSRRGKATRSKEHRQLLPSVSSVEDLEADVNLLSVGAATVGAEDLNASRQIL